MLAVVEMPGFVFMLVGPVSMSQRKVTAMGYCSRCGRSLFVSKQDPLTGGFTPVCVVRRPARLDSHASQPEATQGDFE